MLWSLPEACKTGLEWLLHAETGLFSEEQPAPVSQPAVLETHPFGRQQRELVGNRLPRLMSTEPAGGQVRGNDPVARHKRRIWVLP